MKIIGESESVTSEIPRLFVSINQEDFSKSKYVFTDNENIWLYKKLFTFAKNFVNGYAFVEYEGNLDFIDIEGKMFFMNWCDEKNKNPRVNYSSFQTLFKMAPFSEFEWNLKDAVSTFEFHKFSATPFSFLIKIDIKNICENNDPEYLLSYLRNKLGFNVDWKLTTKGKNELEKKLSNGSPTHVYLHLFLTENDVIICGPFEDVLKVYSEDCLVRLFGLESPSFLQSFIEDGEIACYEGSVHYRSEGLLPFKIDDLYGFKDNLGVTRIEPIYYSVSPFSNGFSIVSRKLISKINPSLFDLQYFLIDHYGNEYFKEIHGQQPLWIEHVEHLKYKLTFQLTSDLVKNLQNRYRELKYKWVLYRFISIDIDLAYPFPQKEEFYSKIYSEMENWQLFSPSIKQEVSVFTEKIKDDFSLEGEIENNSLLPLPFTRLSQLEFPYFNEFSDSPYSVSIFYMLYQKQLTYEAYSDELRNVSANELMYRDANDELNDQDPDWTWNID